MYRRQCLTILQSIDPNIGGTNQWTTQINTVCSACDGAKVFPGYYLVLCHIYCQQWLYCQDSTLVMVAPEPAHGHKLAL